MKNSGRLDYLLLGASLVLLGLGWLGQLQVAFYASTALGLAMSANLVIRAVVKNEFGSDFLALIAIAASALISEWIAAAVITVMLATGRALERWAQGRATNRLSALISRAPKIAHVWSGGSGDTAGTLVDLPIHQVPVGSRILVRSGEVMPLDVIATTECLMDESALTGEPVPREVLANHAVASGVVNAGAAADFVTTSDAENSTYSALVRLVAESRAESAQHVRLANRWALWFVPLALVLALSSWIITGDVRNAVSVIVAATPCPLILAVPIAIIAGLGRSAASGAIIKGGAALEALSRAKAIMLDKTGTLTVGGPSVSSFEVSPGQDAQTLLTLAASLEQHSPHVVARAIVAFAQQRNCKLESVSATAEQHGHGLEGVVAGKRIRLGQLTAETPDWVLARHALQVAVELEGELVGVFGLDDPIRAESSQTIAQLHAHGVRTVVMATGDRPEAAAQVANELGIDRFEARCTPERKLSLLREIKTEIGAEGTTVVVGDGINDAPALAAADVGIAMGARGATAASEAADVVIMEDSIEHVSIAVSIAQAAMRRARQAAFVGVGLSVVAMCAGAAGVIGPTEAALCQEAIDACAILWALVPASKRGASTTER